MSENIDNFEEIEQQPVHKFSEQAYLNYSMYVILDRALPHISDGLKPVQRRIVYAMSELGLKSTTKFKKSARTIGDVLGKYHPHGDSACYEAMVLMAQPFSYRYPLVEGQGNWGSADDPKSFAAMRYTEARLSAYAQALLSELGQGTTEWTANFDGTLEEPVRLPAQLPNILLNGATGIAVGMATDIPPHNLKEVVAACIRVLDEPDVTVEQLCEHIQGPDFPTLAEIITPRNEIIKMYENGGGALRMRAVYTVEDGEIVITALPYHVSGAKVLEQIASQMRAKKLPMVIDLRDESDHENPTRLIIIPRSNRVDKITLMDHLFATTDLEKSYRVNLNMIGLNGKPQVKNLKNILTEWVTYRTQTVRRRLQYCLNQILDRLHILDGLLIAFLNIDEVIRIIRFEDNPKEKLIERFHLTDTQTEAILDLKLRRLAKLEEVKIRNEQNELEEEKNKLEKSLSSKIQLNKLIRKELLALSEKHGDARRSSIVKREEAKAIKEIDMIPSEPITVVLSKKGWIRAAKGHDIDPNNLNYKGEDGSQSSACGRSNQPVVFLDSTGRSYTISAATLPSARGQGEPITGRVNPPSMATFIGVIMAEVGTQFLLASDAGYGFIVNFENLISKNRAGKAILSLSKQAKVLKPSIITDIQKDLIAAVTNQGRLLIFPVKLLPMLNKGKGNKIINIHSSKFAIREEFVVDVAVINVGQTLKLFSGKRYLNLKGKDLEHYYGERGRRGHKLPRGYQRVDYILAE